MDKYDLSRHGYGFAGAPPEQIAYLNAQMETAPINRPGDDVLRANFSAGDLRDVRVGNDDRGWIEAIAVGYVKHKRLPLTIIDGDAWPDLIKRMR